MSEKKVCKIDDEAMKKVAGGQGSNAPASDELASGYDANFNVNVKYMDDEALQNVAGGNAGALAHQYQAQQKVLFQNPNDPSVELTGIIRALSTELGDDGYPYYIILVSSSEQEAELMIGRNYRVSEKYVLAVVG